MTKTPDPTSWAPDDTPPRQAQPERLALRLDELAESLGLSRRFIERAVHKGEFPRADRKVGRVSLWSTSTIRDWLTSQGGAK